LAIKSDKSLSQTYLIARANEVLALSENHIIKVLKGETKLPERVVTQVALELYKRRIPQHVEGNAGNSALTIIKVIKNHLPDNSGHSVDIVDILAERVETAVDDKIQAINKKIKENSDKHYTQDRKVNKA